MHDELHQGKLKARSDKGRFIGYEKASNGYLILMANGKVKISHNVKFDEKFETATEPDSQVDSNFQVLTDHASPVQVMDQLYVENDVLEDGHVTNLEHIPNPQDLAQPHPEQLELDPGEHFEPGDLSDDPDPEPQDNIDDPVQVQVDQDPGDDDQSDANWRNDPAHPDAFKTHPVPDANLQRQNRSRRPNSKYYSDEFANIASEVDSEPNSFKEAARTTDAEAWTAACQAELAVLSKTWKFVDRPKDRKPIGCRWVFKRKRGADGQVIKHKARLVAKGFTQVPGLDFNESFAPVARAATLRTLLAMATVNDWDLENSDISNAYLNAPLKETIYMEQPEGFNDGTGRVIQLNYSLYGLVQAGHNWNDTLNKWITSLGISRSKSDPCLYTKVNHGKTLLLTIYVDDLIYCGDSVMVKWFKDQVSKRFKATHDGNLSWILGMKIERDRIKGELKTSQERHINYLLKKFLQKILVSATYRYQLEPF